MKPLQSVFNISELPINGLWRDFGKIEINQSVIIPDSFHLLCHWHLQYDKIVKRQKELNCELLVYKLPPDLEDTTAEDKYCYTFQQI